MKYVFFGSGNVAVESFNTLRTFFDFDYVVTKTTTEKSIRPLTISETVISVSNKKDVDDFITTNIHEPAIGILIDFGVLLSEQTISSFSHGIVNSHFSLLPKLRGADPITFSILRGETTTGVSLMIVDEGLDTGDVLAQSSIEIPPQMNSSALSSELIDLSNAMLREIIPLYLDKKIVAVPQDSLDGEPTHTKKIVKDDGVVTSSDTAVTIDRKVRAFQDWPTTRLFIGDTEIQIEGGYIYEDSVDINNGQLKKIKVENTKQKLLLLGTSSGIYCIQKLKPAGKKSMSAEAFLAGYSQKLNL